MADDRTYIKVHDGMPDHPKIVGLSPAAKWALVSFWCYCGRNLTDGFVPSAVANREGRKVVTELAASGLIEAQGDGWLCHDYLQHQRSAAEVADMRDKRRRAGSAGGKSRANRQASVKQVLEQNGGKPQADTETDTAKETLAVPRARGSRLSDDWKPTDSDVTWQRSKGISDVLARRETEKFRNYWAAKAGRDGVKVDWSATWKNWMLTALERSPAGVAVSSEKPVWEA